MKQVFNNKPIQKTSVLSVIIIILSFFNHSASQAQWVASGTAGFSAGTANYQHLKEAPNGTRYVAYQDAANSNKTTVMKYNGSDWEVVGAAGFSSGSADLQQLAIDANNTVYVAYRQVTSLIVRKFDGTNWVDLGSSPGFVGEGLSIAIASDNTVHVGYIDAFAGDAATVKKFDGTNWVTIGTAGFSSMNIENMSFAISPNNEPYFAYRDNGNSGKIAVKRYDGAAWVDVATGNVSGDYARYPYLAFDRNGTPYIAFHNGGINVKKLVDNVWTSVGTVVPSEDNFINVSLGFDRLNTPHVAYTFNNNLYLKLYYTGFWADVMLGQPSSGSSHSLIVGNDGHFYVALKDAFQSNKTSVYKYTLFPLIEVLCDGVVTTSVNFGASQQLTKTFTIHNVGNNSLALSGSPIVNVTGGTAFTVSRQPSTTSMNGKTSLTFDVTYQSTGVGNTDNGQLTISSNSAANNNYIISLTATGINGNIDNSRGNMLVLDGADDYVETPSSTSLNNYTTANELTIEYWVRPLSADASKVIFAKRNGTNTGGFFVETAASNTVNHQLYFDGAGWQSLSTTYAANQWQHIAITFKSGDGFKLYKNGVLVANNALTDNLSAITSVLRLGKDSEFSNAGNWQGKIDEWRMWSVARTQSQIRENMFLTLTGKEANLDVYYQFNHESGNVIDKINANNGTVYNGALRQVSEVSVAKGVASRKTVSTTGRVMFGDTKVAVEFTAISAPAANDEFVVYQLYEAPYNNVSGVSNTTDSYWIIKRFGSQTFEIDQLTFSLPKGGNISTIDENNPANFKLYKRNEASMDADWGGSIFAAGQWASHDYGQISFGSLAVPANALNMTSLSEFVISGTATSGLPVDLLSFTAERISQDKVGLQWITTSEVNNEGFAIESSLNGQNYTQIGFVKGALNTGQKQYYQWETVHPKAAYYRLKQLDTDGNYSYSPVRFVAGVATPLRLKTYPNPVVQEVKLQLEGKQEDLLLKVYNAQGKRVLWLKGKLAKVQQGLNSQWAKWQNGTYLLVIQQDNQQLSQRILLQK